MDVISLWCKNNMDVVFFIYGLSFFLLFAAICFQNRPETSRFGFAHILWILAAFGLTHALCEWADMWAIIKGANVYLENIRSLFLVSSFIFLFYFGKTVVFFLLKEEPKERTSGKRRLFC